MFITDQHTRIREYIVEEDLANIFYNTCIHKAKSQLVSTQYHYNDSVLSVICNQRWFSFLYQWIYRDNYLMQIVKQAAFKGMLPIRYRVANIITLFLTILPYICMFFDFYYSWTGMSVFSYLYAGACGLSLFLTVQVAKREWVVHNWNGK